MAQKRAPKNRKADAKKTRKTIGKTAARKPRKAAAPGGPAGNPRGKRAGRGSSPRKGPRKNDSRERVYVYMRERLLAGRPPTMREVQKALGFKAVESVRAHLAHLIDEGLLETEPGLARAYRLPGMGRGEEAARLVPLLGRVPAGDPLTAVEEVEGYLPALTRPGGRGPDGELFALHVRGDSMIGAGILDGDVVIVRRQQHADSGDIVVALVGEEATVKRLRVRRRRVELLPENPAYDPIVPDPADLRLLGRVVEVRRYLDGPPKLL